MQLPYIKYLETLVAGRLTPAEIHTKLGEANLAFPIEGIKVVYQHLSAERPEYFKNKQEAADPDWIRELEVPKMYGYVFKVALEEGTDGIKGAFSIVNDPPMYKLITAMALAKINDEDIELIVNGKFNFQYDGEDIMAFLHYFFNVEDWNLTQKQEYVDSLEAGELKKAYKLALQGDKDYLLWKLGAAPDKSFSLMLRDMMVDSYYNFKERTKNNPDLAQKWGTLAIRITDKLEHLEKDTSNKKNLFEEIEFKLQDIENQNAAVPEGPLATKEPRHISQLSGDNPHAE